MMLTLVSCMNREQKLEMHFNNLHSINTNLSTTGWEIYNPTLWLYEKEGCIQAKKEITDTTMYLNLYYTKKKDKYEYIGKITKTFLVDSVCYRLNMTIFGDTSYFYKYSANKIMCNDFRYLSLDEIEFIVGEYLYILMHEDYNLPEEQRYFLFENIDSLRKVRGDNLPPLPSLSNVKIK